MFSFWIPRKSLLVVADMTIVVDRSAKKFSRHLIFQTKDPFLDNIAVGKFVNLILEDVHGCLINHQCPALSQDSNEATSSNVYSDSTVFAKNLLSSLQSHLSRFERCQCIDDYSQLAYRDIVEFIINKNDDSGLSWFCDMGTDRCCSWNDRLLSP